MLVKPTFWLIAVFVIALAPNLLQGDALYWEAANAVGFVAFAGLLVLLANGYAKAGHSYFHRWFGIIVFVAIVWHSLWFLVMDKAVLDYVMPGAPIYMVLGLSALLIATLITLSSLKRARKRAYPIPGSFQFWHRWQSIFVVLLSALHIVMTGFYFVSLWQWALLVALIGCCFVSPAPVTTSKRAARSHAARATALLLAVWFVATVVFLLIRRSY